MSDLILHWYRVDLLSRRACLTALTPARFGGASLDAFSQVLRQSADMLDLGQRTSSTSGLGIVRHKEIALCGVDVCPMCR